MIKFTQVNICSGDRTMITDANQVHKYPLLHSILNRMLSSINTERI